MTISIRQEMLASMTRNEAIEYFSIASITKATTRYYRDTDIIGRPYIYDERPFTGYDIFVKTYLKKDKTIAEMLSVIFGETTDEYVVTKRLAYKYHKPVIAVRKTDGASFKIEVHKGTKT
jgi:hypothetical protein